MHLARGDLDDNGLTALESQFPGLITRVRAVAGAIPGRSSGRWPQNWSVLTACAVAELRRRGSDGEITLVGEERVAPCQRPALSKSYLSGAQSDIMVALGSERCDA